MSRALDAVVGIRLLKLLSTPIQKSKAFQLGIIDADGKKTQEPFYYSRKKCLYIT